MQYEPFNKRDVLRLLAAAALCAAAVVTFYLREQGILTFNRLSFVDGKTDESIYISSSGAESASVSQSDQASVDSLYPEPVGFSPIASPAREVTVNLFEEAAPTEDIESVLPDLSPETNERAPDEDIQFNVVTRQRDGALRVLIYHTHTEEAYEQTEQYSYIPHGAWHTTNQARSVARVGNELARILVEKYGMIVTHDLTNHEPPNFDTAYTRSLQTLAGYSDRGETFDLYIDLHRDSYAKKHAENTVTIGGVNVARIMMLIGKGEGYAQKPEWPENLALAQSLTDRLNAIAPTLCDKVTIYNGNRYNQHISTRALLIEVGNNRNTLEEALAAMPYLAEAIDIVMGD
ncbi:MAG: stage II sporulation protein P [Oscillospiraceae bacterium]|jgi:stage II sporulation protein P|nr:stage II sporulation protein P [Oscillospiraceae bacterium]